MALYLATLNMLKACVLALSHLNSCCSCCTKNGGCVSVLRLYLKIRQSQTCHAFAFLQDGGSEMLKFTKHTVIVSSINLIAYALAYAGATTLGIEVTPVGAVLTISVPEKGK